MAKAKEINENHKKTRLSFRLTSPLPKRRSDEPPQPHRVSQSQSGSGPSKEKLSTLMSSSAASTTLPLLRRMWDASEE